MTIRLDNYLATMTKKGERTNERGNHIADYWGSAERYLFDFELCTPALGWTQYDTKQDAHYFGVWVNVKTRQTFTYCEGDMTLVTCPDDDHLRAELEDAQRVYGDPPPFAIAIDDKGQTTAFYDERPTV